MDKMTNENAGEIIRRSLQPAKPAKQKKYQPCVIEYKGVRIELSSGKSLWNNPGFAKTALRRHCTDSTYQAGLSSNLGDEVFEDLMKDPNLKIRIL